MPRNLRIPEVPVNDKGFDDFVQRLDDLVSERCGEDADFASYSAAARAVVAQALWKYDHGAKGRGRRGAIPPALAALERDRAWPSWIA